MLKFALSALIAASLGCNPAPDSPMPQSSGLVDLVSMSDEFDNAAMLTNWKHVHKVEGWNADQLAKFSAEGGWLTMVPHTSTWYQDYRGVLVYKDVPGDFVVTTKIKATGRDGRSAPQSQYSLGGILIRVPRSDTARSWQLGKESYVFLALGSADQPGNFQFEVKTTERSQSNLEKIPAASGEALLQVAKIGPHVITLRKQGGSWTVHKRYYRADMPAQLQVGLTVYTDYYSASKVDARTHNSTPNRGGNPDLIARFDYVRYRKPAVPAGLDLGRASDAELLKFLGDVANSG